MRLLGVFVFAFTCILLALNLGEEIIKTALQAGSILVNHIFTAINQHWKTIEQIFYSQSLVKIVIALALAIPISLWLIKHNQPHSQLLSKRKTAIFLAIFLGWLGLHRFYLGQVGRGLLYLILLYFYAPFVVLISWIDAMRFFLMDDELFTLKK